MNAVNQEPRPTPAVEDYLKTIFHLSSERGTAGTSAVAERLGVTAGSVTGMLKRLAEQGWVEHVPYYGAKLTDATALEILGRLTVGGVTQHALAVEYGVSDAAISLLVHGDTWKHLR